MSNTVIISDHLSNRKTFLVFTQIDIDEVIDAWFDPERFFTESKVKLGSRFHIWANLDLADWKYLLITKLEEILLLPLEDQSNEEHPEVSVFHFYIMGIIHKFQTENGTGLEYLKIQKINKDDFIISLVCNTVYSLEELGKPRPNLQVIPGGS